MKEDDFTRKRIMVFCLAAFLITLLPIYVSATSVEDALAKIAENKNQAAQIREEAIKNGTWGKPKEATVPETTFVTESEESAVQVSPSSEQPSKWIQRLTKWLSDRDLVSLVVSIFALLLSIVNLWRDLYRNRVHLVPKYAKFFRYTDGERCLDIIHLVIVNLSSAPAVVSGLTVTPPAEESRCPEPVPFGTYRREIMRRTECYLDGSVLSDEFWHSDYFPIKVDGKGCVNLLIISDDNDPVFELGANYSMTLSTPRKPFTETVVVDKILELNELNDGVWLSECREPY